MKKPLFTLLSFVLLASFANAAGNTIGTARDARFKMKESLQTSCELKLLKNDSLWRKATNNYQERVDLCAIDIANSQLQKSSLIKVVATRTLHDQVLVKIAGDKNLSDEERVKHTELLVSKGRLLESIQDSYDYPRQIETVSGLDEFLLNYGLVLSLHESYSRYMNGTTRLPSP